MKESIVEFIKLDSGNTGYILRLPNRKIFVTEGAYKKLLSGKEVTGITLTKQEIEYVSRSLNSKTTRG